MAEAEGVEPSYPGSKPVALTIVLRLYVSGASSIAQLFLGLFL